MSDGVVCLDTSPFSFELYGIMKQPVGMVNKSWQKCPLQSLSFVFVLLVGEISILDANIFMILRQPFHLFIFNSFSSMSIVCTVIGSLPGILSKINDSVYFF